LLAAGAGDGVSGDSQSHAVTYDELTDFELNGPMHRIYIHASYELTHWKILGKVGVRRDGPQSKLVFSHYEEHGEGSAALWDRLRELFQEHNPGFLPVYWGINDMENRAEEFGLVIKTLNPPRRPLREEVRKYFLNLDQDLDHAIEWIVGNSWTYD
tara:strand:- start:1242 stop:1709 length:468 start_codon:yes stop_codon:yes gene_type:complete